MYLNYNNRVILGDNRHVNHSVVGLGQIGVFEPELHNFIIHIRGISGSKALI